MLTSIEAVFRGFLFCMKSATFFSVAILNSFHSLIKVGGMKFQERFLYCFMYKVACKKRVTSNSIALLFQFYMQHLQGKQRRNCNTFFTRIPNYKKLHVKFTSYLLAIDCTTLMIIPKNVAEHKLLACNIWQHYYSIYTVYEIKT